MATISAKDVQRLRRSTGAGMLDAKSALERSGGDYDAAVRLLREEGKASALKRHDREAGDGAVALVVDGGVGAVVELRCETDFVAKSAEFVQLVEELAAMVAAEGAEAVASRQGDVEKLASTLKENISVGRVIRFDAEGSPDRVVDGYLHLQSDRGVNAVLLEAEGVDRSVVHDIAVHVAFARPGYLSRDDVPSSELEAERAIVEAAARKEGKPEAALEKIVSGRINGWLKERVLLDQSWVRDEKKSISDLLGGGRVIRFAQVVVGG